MPLSAIIWDWNGTLLDDVEYAISCMNPVLESRKLPPLDYHRYRRVFQFPVEEYYRQIGFDFSREPFSIPAREFIDNYYAGLTASTLHKGARQLVVDLHHQGIRQAILSAMEIKPLLDQLNPHNLRPYLDDIEGLNHINATSKVAEGRRLLNRLQAPADEILLIGDTSHDHEVAVELGLRAVMITHGHQAPARFNGEISCVPDFASLRNYLKNNCQIYI